MTERDPVSWFLIEAGWTVVDAAGEEVGSVDEVVGDSSDDIFNGLSISTSLLGKPRYVPSEQVGEITEGRVHLKLSKDQLGRLGEYGERAADQGLVLFATVNNHGFGRAVAPPGGTAGRRILVCPVRAAS